MTFYSAPWDDTATDWDDATVSWDGYGGGVLQRLTVQSGGNQFARPAAGFDLPVAIKAWDGLNSPVPAAAVTLTLPDPAVGAGATFPGGLLAATVATGPDGVATFPPMTAGTTAGGFLAAATVAAVGVDAAAVNMTVTADDPAVVDVVAGDNQSTQVTGLYPAGFQVRLTDRYANPCPAIGVVFTAPTLPGPSGYWATPGNTTQVASTNGVGVATTPPTFRANTSAGGFTVGASPINADVAASLVCTNTAGAPVLILATNGTPQSAARGTEYPAAFTATVSDQWGNGAGGLDVTFAPPATPPSGAFAAANPETVTTALDGTATPSVFTADDTLGTFRVSATSPGVPGEALFLCTNMLARDPLFDGGEYSFVSPDGEGVNLRVLRGQFGRLMPVVELFEEQVPGVPGYRFLGARHVSRDINLPCLVESVYEGIDALRQIARVLDPTKGVGSLRVRLPDGTVRQIGATYAGGLDSSREENPHAVWAPLVFRTPDPYWTDGVEQTAQAPAGAVSAEVVNDGDYETWPVIHLAAPAAFANPVLTNTAVNQKIDIRAAGRDMVIDCRPGYRSVVVDGRPNYAALTQDSELWPLVAGSQLVTFAAAPLNFTTTASWNRRYLAI